MKSLAEINTRKVLALGLAPLVYRPEHHHEGSLPRQYLDWARAEAAAWEADFEEGEGQAIYSANERKLEDARALLQAGRVERGLVLLQEIGGAMPWLPGYRAALERAAQADAETAGELLRTRRLEPRGTYGGGILKGPVGIVAHGGALFVSDFLQGKVFRFAPGGGLLGEAGAGLSAPLGMFRDGAGRLWVCDFPARQLVALDEQGGVVARVDTGALAGLGAARHPAYGCAWGRDALVLLRDETHRSGVVARVSLDDPAREAALLDHWPLGVASSCCDFAGALLVSGCLDRLLCRVDDTGTRLELLAAPLLEREVRWLEPCGDRLFLTAGANLYALDAQLRILFRADLRPLLQRRNATPHGLALSGSELDRQLHVVDFKGAEVVCFAV